MRPQWKNFEYFSGNGEATVLLLKQLNGNTVNTGFVENKSNNVYNR